MITVTPDNRPFIDLVQVRADGAFGTGLLVGRGLVLTALHCVSDPNAQWRPLENIGVYLLRELQKNHEIHHPAHLVWPTIGSLSNDPRDIAVLQINEEDPPSALTKHEFGEIPSGPAAGSARGFPRVSAGTQLPGGRIEHDQPGRVQYTNFTRRTLTIDATGSHELVGRDRWAGLSGGPLLVNDKIVGVMREVPDGWKGEAIEAEPLGTVMRGPDGLSLSNLLNVELPLPESTPKEAFDRRIPFGPFLVAGALLLLTLFWHPDNVFARIVLTPSIWIALIVLLICSAADFELKPAIRDLAAQWLLPRKAKRPDSAAEALSLAFEAVFGSRHLSAYCFVRNAVASVIFLGITLILIRWLLGATVKFNLGTWASLAVWACTVNVFGDYLALYVTRTMLGAYRRGTHILAVLLIGLAATVATFCLTMGLAITAIYGIATLNGTYHDPTGESFGTLVIKETVMALEQPYLDLFHPDSPDLFNPVGYRRLLYASFLTTLVTSIWLWAALFLSPFFRILVWSGGAGLTIVGTLIDVERWPFRALGYIGVFTFVGGGCLLWTVNVAIASVLGLAFGPTR